MKQEQLCLFDIGYVDKGTPQYGFEMPKSYALTFIAKTGRSYLVWYRGKQHEQALDNWSRYPSKLFVYW
jgi:hypothetical protein